MREVRKGDGGEVLIRTPFENFYETVFKPALENVNSGPVFNNGHTIREASWDRKAAYLLFLLRPEAVGLPVGECPPAPVKAPPAPTLASVEDEFG